MKIMKTAKLQQHGKGWKLVGEKTLIVPGNFGLTDDMNNQEVEFDNTGGPVKCIRYNGKDYTKQENPQQDRAKYQNYQDQTRSGGRQGGYQQRQSYRGGQVGGGQRQDPARAPYNFVPLNEQVIPADDIVRFDEFVEGRLSGYIDLEIAALTDIFVRGSLQKFFSINGNFAIPGSSLRGLIRSLTEIVSYSRMEMLQKNRKLFFRNISDDFYKNLFLDVKGNDIEQKSKAGWLSKSGNKYYIQEAPKFYKVDRRSLSRIGLDIQDEVYQLKEIWFDPKSSVPIHVKRIKDRQTGEVKKILNLHYNKVNVVNRSSNPGMESATLVITGLFGSAKHFQWIIPKALPSAAKHPVTEIMQEYQLDENRDEKADLIRALRNAKGKAIPCFFISDKNGKPISVGHTGIFRHPYKYEIGHAVKQRSDVVFDIAKSIFGFVDVKEEREIIQAGKVFFEDAFAAKVTGTEFGALKILSSPKPTSFQLYLEQSGKQQSHWGSDGNKIRGHKLYWHSLQNWRNPEVLITAGNHKELISKAFEDKNNQYTVGEVLKSGSTFRGRIRFDNLSDKELGALLFAIDLPDGCAHKLGMGKSLGLGSVRIKPKLTIIQRKVRYEEVFDEDGWEASENHEMELKHYKDIFAKYIAQETRQRQINDAATYWNQDMRLKELKHLLLFEHNVTGVAWENRTRYMLIEHPTYEPPNEYRDKNKRHDLPLPSEVIKPDTYKND